MSQETENPGRNSLFRNILPASPYGSIFWAYLDPYQTRKLQKEKILAERHKKNERPSTSNWYQYRKKCREWAKTARDPFTSPRARG
jgi:hypothetical protein